MIEKNIVMVETLNSVGTGVLYPCKYENERKNDLNYYIVFTNSHVLDGIGIGEEPNQDMQGFVKVELLDDYGRIVKEEDIQELFLYNGGWDFEKNNDIAAILLGIKRRVSLTVETRIYSEVLENRSVLYTEGYPGVMLEDVVNPRVQFEGKVKTVFPENRKIGIYQITDDYHWYNNFRDRHLLSGLSGGIVYKEIDGKYMILGMNQSVSDISQGENPFKLVYYLKMEYILHYLMEKNCILYQRIDEYSYRIEWILGKTFENGDERSLVLLGGSGAGKSTFATDFAFHRKNILATNDGQTTKAIVVYDYNLIEDNPYAEIEFFTRRELINIFNKLRKNEERRIFDPENFLFLFENEERKRFFHDTYQQFFEKDKIIEASEGQIRKFYDELIEQVEGYGEQAKITKEVIELSEKLQNKSHEKKNEVRKSSGRCMESIATDDYYWNRKKEDNRRIAWKIRLDCMDEKQIRILQLCLQATDGNSFSGLIKKVRIQDRVSEMYAMELKKLGIKKLQFIDTQGLDHFQYENNFSTVLNTIFDELKELDYVNTEKQKQNYIREDTAVLYVKKLDSGKPDELRYILPIVQDKFLGAPIYCVFTGIDIYYRTAEEIRNIRWITDGSNIPKSIQYLLDENTKTELCKNLNFSEQKRECLYLTMKNNLIPYCGKEELLHNYDYYKNNLFYISKLLISIAVKESSSLDIVDQECCAQKPKFQEAVKDFWNTVIKRTKSITYSDKNWWPYYREAEWRILETKNVSKDAYDWDIVFQKISDAENWVDCDEDSLDASVLEPQFGKCLSFHHSYYEVLKHHPVIDIMAVEAGCSMQDIQYALTKVEWTVMSLLGRVLYDDEFIYLDDIFALNQTIIEVMKNRNQKNLKGNWERFFELFIGELINEIIFDNEEKIRNIIKINPDFEDELKKMEMIFRSKYGSMKENGLDFDKVMKRYFELRIEDRSNKNKD